MKKWSKVETKMDSLIIKIIKKFWELYHKLAPKKFQTLLIGIRDKSQEKKTAMIIWFQITLAKVMAFVPQLMGKFTGFIGNFQGHVTHWIISLRSLKGKKFSFKGFFLSIWNFIKFPFVKFKEFLDTLKPSTIWTTATLSTVMIITAVSIWYNSEDLYLKVRGPASDEDAIQIGVRPNYYKRDEKYFTIFNLRMPLYIESIHNPKLVKIDFTIQTSNKYIKAYFLEVQNEYLIHDRLNMMVHPIIPSLPLSEEGKVILKDKLMIELNGLIKDLKLEGEIKDVYINSILAV